MRTLDPADFTSLWDACTRCFYLAVARGFPRPRSDAAASSPMMDRIAAGLAGRRTDTLAAGMPAGVLETGPRKVQSAPIDVQVPEGILRCVIQGTLDFAVRGDDGAYTVVVLEVGEQQHAEASASARRLHAYAHALERDETVAGLGVLGFEAGGAGAVPGRADAHWAAELATDRPRRLVLLRFSGRGAHPARATDTAAGHRPLPLVRLPRCEPPDGFVMGVSKAPQALTRRPRDGRRS
jgi:hypothetical protein